MDLSKTVLGIEFGSTRIKAQLLDSQHLPIASGSHEWENRFENGIWTYSFEDIRIGLQTCFVNLKRDLMEKYDLELTTVGAIGVSAMMHGYLPLDADGVPLTEFRTWRNTCTEKSAEILSDLFHFNIPQRWSIAHLYQAILNEEPHLPCIAHLSTLAGYIHWCLTGKHVMGIGEASGVFPIDYTTCQYDTKMLDDFDSLVSKYNLPWKIRDILPTPLLAGENAGYLSEDGALLLDPTGTFLPGIPVAPCEGDAETGMVATNSVRARTGNVSAGTSDFAMIVLERPIGVHMEVGIVATPAGMPVAMVHCSNCTSDINAWINIFSEFADEFGLKIDRNTLYTKLFQKALEGAPDCGGLLSYNYYSGEAILSLNEGRPVFLRTPDSSFTLSNFMRMHLQSALATLKYGMDILRKEEHVEVERIYGHGGFFKTPSVGQRILSAAIGAPVSVMETAGEGGPYGMALLCAYLLWKDDGECLEDYLDCKVFRDVKSFTVMADSAEIEGFDQFASRFVSSMPVETSAVATLK